MSRSTSIEGNGTTQNSAPLSVEGDYGSEEARKEKSKWWKKVLDTEEAKIQIFLSIPMILTIVFYYLITLISVMFAGHLGKLQLAGATLANSWATASGFLSLAGLSGALETLCGQGFGAKEYRLLGIYLQASCIISFIFSIIISIIWFYTEPILVLLHQGHDISKEAALFMKFLIPGQFAVGFLHNIMRFLQTQSIVGPVVLLSAVPLILHVGIAYALVHWTDLGFKGAPLATSISLWISVLLLVLYIIFAKKFKQTWQGFSLESFSYIHRIMKLALPSAAMVCLEGWAFEILVFLAGLMPDSETSTSLIAICINTESIAYMISFGLSASASTRVSNELGAGNSKQAKNASAVAFKLSILLALLLILPLGFGHKICAGLFSDSSKIKNKFAAMVPLLAISITADTIHCVLSGVARGCGWQHMAVYVNLANFYLIGVPVACLLGFKFKLHAKGLWIGFICGLSCQAVTLLFITKFAKWRKINIVEEHKEKQVDV